MIEITTSDCRTILENAAARLEAGWKQGGRQGFRPSAINSEAKELCLVDSIALETRLYFSDLNTPVERGEASLRVKVQIVPALHKVVMEHLQGEFLASEDNMVRNYIAALALAPNSDLSVIWHYNDALCQGGHEAAEMARKAAKEL